MENAMNRVTLVCCYNNYSLYDALLADIAGQDEKVDVIGINNTERKYKSCACAYNSIVDSIKTEFVIYAHQDIRLLDKYCIGKFVDYLCRISADDVLGVAGCGIADKLIHSNILNGSERVKVGQRPVHEIEECFTFDECFFGGHTEYFRCNRFDEKVCDDFHLYAVEQCLRTRSRKGKAYVCDLNMYHLSKGNKNYALNKSFFKLCEKYQNEYGYIYATCCRGHTAIVLRTIEYILRKLKYKLKI